MILTPQTCISFVSIIIVFTRIVFRIKMIKRGARSLTAIIRAQHNVGLVTEKEEINHNGQGIGNILGQQQILPISSANPTDLSNMHREINYDSFIGGKNE